nr:hypothetical protein Iba_chr12bCG11340 [Ipomoea batatas]GME17637.1 hypothetical protein Iba_scaffold19149CG0010 [Ipomoea batatas]
MEKLKYFVDYSVAYRSWKELPLFTANALPLYTTPPSTPALRAAASSISSLIGPGRDHVRTPRPNSNSSSLPPALVPSRPPFSSPTTVNRNRFFVDFPFCQSVLEWISWFDLSVVRTENEAVQDRKAILKSWVFGFHTLPPSIHPMMNGLV